MLQQLSHHKLIPRKQSFIWQSFYLVNVIKILYMLILSTKALQVISPIISISPNPITDQMELDQIWSTGLRDNTDNDFTIISLWE